MISAFGLESPSQRQPWCQATLDEARTKQLSVMYRFKQVLESGEAPPEQPFSLLKGR
jgi:hypothetical protein